MVSLKFFDLDEYLEKDEKCNIFSYEEKHSMRIVQFFEGDFMPPRPFIGESIMFLMEGKISYKINRKDYIMKKNQIIVFNDDLVSLTVKEDCLLLFIRINGEEEKEFYSMKKSQTM
jgi:hypothetical protein